ncbi:MAG: hypothetical protein WBC92_16410 [Terracidiphilus sp.]
MCPLCRHIKPNGLKCQSPALRGHVFCYFHARRHSASRLSSRDDLRLPIPTDGAAIQQSLSQIAAAIVSSRISSRRAGQLLWGLQIASQTLPRNQTSPSASVKSITQTRSGREGNNDDD